MERIKEFLSGLTKLTEKHGIVISGEGTDKPFLDDIENGELGYDLEFDCEMGKYTVKYS